MRHIQNDLLSHDLDGRRQIHFALRNGGFRAAWRPPEERGEFPVGHGQTAAEIEIFHVQPNRAVRENADEFFTDQIRKTPPAVRSQPHEFILSGVDAESGEIGERRIQQPDRVRECQLLQQPDLIPAALPDGGGGPFADPVHCENRSTLKRRRKKGAGRMGLVV